MQEGQVLHMQEKYLDSLPEDEDYSAPEPPDDNPSQEAAVRKAFIRAENEDDDHYDPYSDRPAKPEPLFERDPWN